MSVALCLVSPIASGVAIAAPASANPDAEALLNSGIDRFDAGDYEGALIDLDASIELDRSAKALYAKAQSLYKLNRCPDAIPLYNEVLEILPEDSPAWSAVKDALVTCVEELAKEQDEPDVVAPPPIVDSDPEGESEDDVDEDRPPTGPPPKAWYKDPYAPVLIGVGAVGVGVGGYFLSEASKENAASPEQYDEFAKKGERVQQLQIRGGVILGVGGALVLAGVIRYTVLGVKGRRATTAFVPTAGPRWAGISASGRF